MDDKEIPLLKEIIDNLKIKVDTQEETIKHKLKILIATSYNKGFQDGFNCKDKSK